MACAVCASDDFRFLFEQKRFRLGQCSECGLVQVTNMPAPEVIGQAYDKGFYDNFYPGLENDHRQQRYVYLNFDNKLDQIEIRLGRRGRLLDVGCSFGFFLDAARRRGWTVAGIEVSEYAARYARERLELLVTTKPIMQAPFEEASFDVITMWYVIEHLSNPKGMLQAARHFLRDDGILVISTPNVGSHLARIQGKKWRMWIPPEHLIYFCPKTMERLLKRCNLELIDQETALPYEKYLRELKLYRTLNRLKVSDNVVYYVRKVACSPGGSASLQGGREKKKIMGPKQGRGWEAPS